MNEDKEKIISIIMKVLNLDNITEQSTQDDYDEWDSMSYLSIVMEIEKDFKLQINEKNLNNFNSVKNIYNEIINARK